MSIYVAKKDTWYDEGTIVECIEIYDDDPTNGFGLFRGLKSDKKPGVVYGETEICALSEFVIL